MENNKEELFNGKVFFGHLILTFVIMGICWGICIITGINGMTLNDCPWLYIPWFAGGISPAIASYILLKKNGEVTGFKDWIKHVFDFKHSVQAYILTILFPILHTILMCLLSGYRKGLPIYWLPLMILAMIFAGGLEEAGWRYITFPELNKKLGFLLSALITAVIWWLWHLPLFFIPGASQYQKNFFVFGIMVLGLSFMMGAIRSLTGSVWLCVLCHGIVNSIGNFYHYDMYGSYPAAGITAAVIILVSCAISSCLKKFFKNF
ncbi:MAG: CPBP family intramembrane metalloprotease [Lachnospiraceae bacterium]|nr:CPBP family intramembrane metalloprotease [Lachnospiraceae bacterium]